MIHHKQFYYLRHGQTEWNLIGRLQGRSDIPLNENGIKQAHAAKAVLAGEPITTICCSPLKRARKTADVINETLACPIVEIPDLQESDFGSSEGSSSYNWLSDWLLGDASTTPHDVEPMADFLARTTAAINQALEYPEPVLIVAHGGTYMPINKCLSPDQQWNIQNAQPVRHDPPDANGGEWGKFCL